MYYRCVRLTDWNASLVLAAAAILIPKVSIVYVVVKKFVVIAEIKVLRLRARMLQ